MSSPVRLECIRDICTACFMLQRISLTFFELFSNFDKNCDFFNFERFYKSASGQNSGQLQK